MKKHILYVVANDDYFLSHRLHLAIASLKAGYKVSLLTAKSSKSGYIESLGIKVFNVSFVRGSTNLLTELKTIYRIYKIFKKLKPQIIHNVGLKPSIYGSLIANFLKFDKVINAISGMGYAFTEKTLKAKIISFLIKTSFVLVFNKKNHTIIVQNHDDERFFQKIVKKPSINVIYGAGVNIKDFQFTQEPSSKPYVVTLVSRILKTKGVYEFIEAAKILKSDKTVPDFIFQLVGEPDFQNPASIGNNEIKSWQSQELIKYLGKRDYINEIYKNSHIAVLPSYREGLPKSLLEAASCGRPIVSCDVTGCNVVVQDGYNGILVEVKNSRALAQAIKNLLCDKDKRIQMGKNGRNLVEEKFSELIVQEQTLKLYL
jgi:glycosyltransferase involved in cell wall biosynthesis